MMHFSMFIHPFNEWTDQNCSPEDHDILLGNLISRHETIVKPFLFFRNQDVVHLRYMILLNHLQVLSGELREAMGEGVL